MTFFYQYLFRVTICFAAMYLFYAIVLRRLTFYNYNRWYLLGYSALCFVIPLINFSPKDTGVIYSSFVEMIPAVAVSKKAVIQPNQWFEANNLILWIFLAGVFVMLTKLLIQLFSYKKLVSDAAIISNSDTVKLYQIDKDIVPFSFGNSIFINQHLHDEAALKEILRHEFVHVKQKHTLDILWGELLCILNWYNPFVWLIRKAIRENLEFIADDKVIQTGIDKQQYQYLLLRVMGNNNFSITNSFNFSSFKKRIAMMNKIKTAKIHLLKFLFLIPLLGVLLLSFRDVIETNKMQNTFTVSGIIVNVENYKPIAGVEVKDNIYDKTAITDERGFYTYDVEVGLSKNDEHFMSFKKAGYEDFGFGLTNTNFKTKKDDKNIVSNIFLKKNNAPENITATSTTSSIGKKPDYDYSKEMLNGSIDFFKNRKKEHVNDSSVFTTTRMSIEDKNKLAFPKSTESTETEMNNKEWKSGSSRLSNKILSDETITITGIIVDGATYEPLSNVIIEDKNNQRKAITNDKGFYSFNMSYAKYDGKEKFSFILKREGFLSMAFPLSLSLSKEANSKYILFDVGMKANSTPDSSARTFAAYNSNFNSTPSYKDAMDELNDYQKRRNKY